MSATQGTVDEIAARALTNGALAERVDQIGKFPRSYKREQRAALLAEAARRLRWPDAYEKARDAMTGEG